MAISTIAGVGVGSSGTILTTGAPQSGGVIQVVSSLTATVTSSGTNSGTYVATGLSATITPKFSTSKIVIMMMARIQIRNPSSGESGNGIQIQRNGTGVFTDASGYFNLYINSSSNTYFNNLRNCTPVLYTDSPSSTSALTYTLAINSYLGQSVLNTDGQTSTITLMEIAA